MKNAEFKRYAHYGPGGRSCPCCGPAPNFRKRADRTARRREKQIMFQEMRQEIESAGVRV